jgi:glucan phosphorylase
MNLLDPFVPNRHIAYFSMEIALRPEIHSYAGGLSMLAGDVARACADPELPVVFVTLISREAYLRQEIGDGGRQIDLADPWAPEPWLSKLDAKIALQIEWREIWVRPWLYLVERPAGYEDPVILLDTDLEENAPEDRRITHRLYGGDQADRLRQEIVLGIGGVAGPNGARLLSSDAERLEAIHRRYPFPLVFAGKAHPQDATGEQAIEGIDRRISESSGVLPIAFLPNHDMDLARYLVSGADVWLNTPIPPLEASGTSGMKAVLNGVLNFSVPDGWWREALIEGETGWAIGDGVPEHADQDAGVLYDKLEQKVCLLL